MSKNKKFWGPLLLLAFIGAALAAYQVYKVNLAHTTFDRYYAFRGCVQLVDKTDTYADCELADGSAIRMVVIDGKWYLEGDGPGVW